MKTMSMSEASLAGVSALAGSAEAGEPVELSRHGRVVAEVVSAGELANLRRERDQLLEAVLVLSRVATDSGGRTDLDDALAAFGLDRHELEAELDAEIAAGKL